MELDYQKEFEANRKLWDSKTQFHVDSDFYQMEKFMDGWNSLDSITLGLLGDIKGKKILHLQCHFGQDSMSMSRMGAHVTGVDFSLKAIEKGRQIAESLDLDTKFIHSSVYDFDYGLAEQFDIVFASYGTIIWLPDLNKWAKIIRQNLKADGKFVFVEFHPMINMYEFESKKLAFGYFNTKTHKDLEQGTYADKNANIKMEEYFWNHSLAETYQALKNNGIQVVDFNEYDESPYHCFGDMIEIRPGWYQYNNKLSTPHVFSYVGQRIN